MSSRRKISWILTLFGLLCGVLYVNQAVRGGTDDWFGFLVFAVLPLGIGLILRTKTKKERAGMEITPEMEKSILHLAAEQENLLTAADVALHTTLSMEQAGDALEAMRRKGQVHLRVADNGALVYEFQDVLSMEAKLNAERV
ncbi:hypothetical protein FHS19_002417 [Paenibacillus rhizosphaerae]|uniref:Uncharacterized protein n=1 Tax=Paenibacillus rhizosphaerae TaxID=297318 RepID=A0A839TML9_9BACL|nr:hypothetical protein [Paenibacillus rhizosphaerae]MBB3127763.1 hypothetical protein [Paenibacillus rhizosphaerae]